MVSLLEHPVKIAVIFIAYRRNNVVNREIRIADQPDCFFQPSSSEAAP